VERRLGNVIASKAGGTAGRGAKTDKLSLPTAWVQALGLEEYDPLAIVRKTQGRMAEDDQWLEALP
jgi:hypothetical protein